MPIPDIDTIQLPVLRLLEDNNEHRIRDVIAYITDHFQLTADERIQLTPVGRKPTVDTRVLWAVSQLRHAGLLQNSQRGIFRITERGIQALNQNPSRIDRKFLMQYPEFRRYIGLTNERSRTLGNKRNTHRTLELLNHRSNRIIIKEGTRFEQIQYRKEEELEALAVQNKEALFGNSMIYFDTKKVMTSSAKIRTIADGLLLTIPNLHHSRLWLVEYELSQHDPHKHIVPQISKFVNAMKNDSTRRIIRETLYNAIKQNSESKKKIRALLQSPDDEIYPFLEKVVDKDPGIIMVIDKRTQEIEEVTRMHNPMILEFIAFRNNRGDKTFLLDCLPIYTRNKKSPR